MKSSIHRFVLIVVLTFGCVLNATADDLLENFYGREAMLLLENTVEIADFEGFALGVASGTSENFPISSVVPPYAVRRGDEGIELTGPPGMGPLLFSERATTQGRGMFNVSTSFTHIDYDTFEGDKLSDISITAPSVLPGAALTTELDIDVEAAVTAVALAYGVADNVDIAVVVPWVTVDFDNRTDIFLTVGGTTSKVASFREHDNYEGLGDVLVRGKWFIRETRAANIALGFDYKTKTGDEDKLLGTGYETYKPFLILSKNYKLLVPHLNAGYSFADAGRRSDELSRLECSAGVEFVPSRRFTAAVDVIGFNKVNAHGDDFGKEILNLSMGFKWAALQWAVRDGVPTGNLVVYANVMKPINDKGARADWIPTLGMQVQF